MSVSRRSVLALPAMWPASALACAPQSEAPALAHVERTLSAHINEARGEDFGAAVAQAQAHGVSAVPFVLHWDEIERRSGRYEPRPNWAEIANRHFPLLGLRVHLVVPVIDTNNDRRPAWLRGRPFADPECVAAFGRFLEWLVARTPAIDLISFSIGNEIDALLGSEPARWADFAAFWRAGAERFRALRPRVPVGGKLMWGGYVGGQLSGDGLRAAESFVDQCDRLMISYYPIEHDFAMRPPEAAERDIAALVERRRDKLIEVAEIGYSTSPACRGTRDGQVAFVESVFRAWDANSDQIPLVSFFAWSDLAPDSVGELTRYYGVRSPGFIGFLSELGLRDADGRPKPALAALMREARSRNFLWS